MFVILTFTAAHSFDIAIEEISRIALAIGGYAVAYFFSIHGDLVHSVEV